MRQVLAQENLQKKPSTLFETVTVGIPHADWGVVEQQKMKEKESGRGWTEHRTRLEMK